MSAFLWRTSTINAFNTSLNGSISASDTTITLTTVTGLQAPGIITVDRTDGSNNPTPVKREYISFTGISGLQITGCTRGLGGSQAQTHSSGAQVEETISTTHWNEMLDFIQVAHDAAGRIVTSTATISIARIYDHINASGASITGNFPFNPGWVVGGVVSLATTNVGKPLPMPQAGLLQFFSAVLRTPVSGGSLLLDINRNGSSIFSDQNTRLIFPAGGTYVSTASIGLRQLNAGDILTMDIDNGGGTAADLTVVGRAK